MYNLHIKNIYDEEIVVIKSTNKIYSLNFEFSEDVIITYDEDNEVLNSIEFTVEANEKIGIIVGTVTAAFEGNVKLRNRKFE